MNAAMVARGPDHDRTYTDFFSGVSLGTRRLSIIDVKAVGSP
jgi:asparagine synthetase B (glutamine-hydrolysing)